MKRRKQIWRKKRVTGVFNLGKLEREMAVCILIQNLNRGLNLMFSYYTISERELEVFNLNPPRLK